MKVIHASSDSVIEPAARAAYRTAFRRPSVRHAMCEDYRAALEEDLECGRADRPAGSKLDCSALALWPASQSTKVPFPDDVWRLWADDVVDAMTTGDHLQPEDRPTEVLKALTLLPAWRRSRRPRSRSTNGNRGRRARRCGQIPSSATSRSTSSALGRPRS